MGEPPPRHFLRLRAPLFSSASQSSRTEVLRPPLTLPPMAPSTEPWGKSKCTRAQLASFEEAGILRARRWRIPAAREVTPDPREGEFICFASDLERGLGFPTSLFFRRFCAYYGIQPSDLGPHSTEKLAIFMAFCECYMGCHPYFPLWQELFHGRIGRGWPDLSAKFEGVLLRSDAAEEGGK